MAEQANKHRCNVVFKPGDLVWLSTKNLKTSRSSKKLDYKNIGLFKVAKLYRISYALDLPAIIRIYNMFHPSLLSLYPNNLLDS